MTSSPETITEEFIKGLQTFTSNMLKKQLTIRIFPDRFRNDIQFVCHVPFGYYDEESVEETLLFYGPQPNVPFTVFGLITSVPSYVGNYDLRFMPSLELTQSDVIREQILNSAPSPESQELLMERLEFRKTALGIEGSIRNLFPEWDKFRQFFGPAIYPRVTVYPLALYRTISSVAPSIILNEERREEQPEVPVVQYRQKKDHETAGDEVRSDDGQ